MTGGLSPKRGAAREQAILDAAMELASERGYERMPSLIGMLEAIRDDATLREIIRKQVRDRSHEVGRIICARALARGETIDAGRSDAVLDLAFSQVFTETLFRSGASDQQTLERLVDDVLLPLLSGSEGLSRDRFTL